MEKNFDYEIWEYFRKGDEKSFSYVFDTYHLQLFEYGQRFTKDEHLVKDSIQDLFFELARKKQKLSPTNNILFYLLKSIRQKIMVNLKKKGTITQEEDYQINEFRLYYSTDIDQQEKELRLNQLAEAINQLPPRQKEAIYLKFYKNLSNKQVSDIMQINYQSVGNNLQKAISKLKSILNSDTDAVILLLQNFIQ